jgi:hypothetical protein
VAQAFSGPSFFCNPPAVCLADSPRQMPARLKISNFATFPLNFVSKIPDKDNEGANQMKN